MTFNRPLDSIGRHCHADAGFDRVGSVIVTMCWSDWRNLEADPINVRIPTHASV